MKDVEYYMEDPNCRISFVGEFIVIETNYYKEEEDVEDA